jgi:hypothetical protein
MKLETWDQVENFDFINGKRKKHEFTCVYANVWTWWNRCWYFTIPTDAIERVENLRDGASAQYGSDAIACNEYYLEKSTSGGSVTLRTGITGQGDGEMYGVAKQWNKVGEKGFLNYTVDF